MLWTCWDRSHLEPWMTCLERWVLIKLVFETFIMSNSDISPEELIQIVADRSGQTKESLVAEISASMNMTSEQFIARMHGYDDYTIS